MNTAEVSKIHILIVDDDPFSLLGVGKYLESEGFNITTVENSEQAIAQIKHNRFDLVISDLILPGDDGIKVLKKAKAKDPDMIVIILTAYGALKSSIDALRLGADDYLLKPIEPEDLNFRINRCLESLSLKRQKKNAEKMLQKTLDELEDRVVIRTGELTRAQKKLQEEIDERKLYQQRLRTLSSEIVLAEERERRRIADALHDQIGQSLAVAKLKLGDLRLATDLNAVHREPLNDIYSMLAEMIKDIWTLTFELSPPVLYQFGIIEAIQWLIEKVEEHHPLQITFKCNSRNLDKYLSDGCRVHLYSSIRELIINIVKHSQARRAEVCACLDDSGVIRIDIEDDGLGFDASRINENTLNHQSFGLFSIRERLNDLGGDFRIQSEVGKGTRCSLEIPGVSINRT